MSILIHIQKRKFCRNLLTLETFQTCMNVFVLLNKGRYSEECGKQRSSGAPLTSIVFFFLLWKSMVPKNSLVTNFLQNVFLCVQQNKEIHTGLE